MVIHILNDGTELEDIRGHEVPEKECPGAYELMKKINEEAEQ